MINKLAKVLLNSIRTNQPKQRIIRLAKILYKLASKDYGVSVGHEYHTVMVKRFLEVFSSSEDVTSFLQGRKFASTIVFRTPRVSENPIQRELLNKLTTVQIDDIVEKIVSSNPELKEWLENKYNIGVDPVKIKNRYGYQLSYSFGTTQHFGYRAFFRGLDFPVIQLAAEELIKNIIDNPLTVKRAFEYVSNIKKYGFYVSLVIGEITKNPSGGRMDLITTYPNQKGMKPTFPEKKVVEEKVIEDKPIAKPTYSISEGTLTPEQFLKDTLHGTDTIPFKIWTKGTEYTDANTVPGILEYPKQLERHITPEGIAKIAKRIGVAMRNSQIGNKVKVQIDCNECYHVNGKKTSDFVLLVVTLSSEGNKFKITEFTMTDASSKSPRAWWGLDSYESTK